MKSLQYSCGDGLWEVSGFLCTTDAFSLPEEKCGTMFGNSVIIKQPIERLVGALWQKTLKPLLGESSVLTDCAGFGWEGVNFLHSS